MEKFILINGFNNYAISNYGRIKNVKKNTFLNLSKNKKGYLCCSLCQNSFKKTFLVHRLVAIYFISNLENKPQVNHIDGNKSNNCFLNLEWATAKENDLHARETGLKNQNKPIVAKDLKSKNTFVFNSISEASGILGINKGSIHKVLSKKRNKTHDYEFYYL